MTDLERDHRVRMSITRLAGETRALWDQDDDVPEDRDLAGAFYTGLAEWDADEVRRLAADASAQLVDEHTVYAEAVS